MPLKVGELFATLEIDDKDFSKGLKSAENQTKVLDSAIKASEKTIERYRAALEKAQSALRAAQQAQDALVNKLNTAKQAQATLQQEVDRLNAAYKAQKKATGENSDAANELGLELLEAQNALKKSSEEVKNLSKQVGDGENNLKKLGKSVDEIAGNLDNAEQELSGFRTQLGNANTLLNSNAARLSAAGDAMQKYAQHVKEATEWQRELGNLLTLGITMPVIGAFGYAAKEAISFEDAFAGVEKTVDGSEAELAQLEAQLVEMSHNIPVTAEELSGIAQSAGQLGIQLDTIGQFTDTIAKLNSATNLGEEGATILARIANITGMEQTGENFERLGSAIVELGNTSATTESEIANMAMRLAGAGAQVGMSISDILGISAALSSLGLQAEAGGSAISRVLTDMQLAVETGNDSLQQFADVAGMTSEEFVAAFDEDAAGALAAFVSGLGSGTQSATQLLDKMGITEVVITDTLKRASNAEDLFAASIENANRAYEENVALTNEAEKRNQTMASRLTMVKNRVDTAARSLGNTLMPVLEEVAEKVGEAADWFASLDEATVKNVVQWGALAAAVGPTLKLLGTANKTFSSVAKGIGSLTKGISGAGSLGGALKALGSNISSLLGPAGIAGLAVAAGALVVNLIDVATGAKAAREALASMNETANEWKNTVAETIYDTSSGLAAFGLDTSAFDIAKKDTENWLENLYSVWSDGEKETDEIVSQFVDGFTSVSDGVREALENLQGETSSETLQQQMQQDIETLNQLDSEVESLLNKKQNGLLSEDDKVRLEDLVEQREAIIVKYKLEEETNGFEQIATGVEAAIERARVQNPESTGDISIYEDAFKAGAEGMKAYNQQLNERYDAEYAIIAAMEDGAAKSAALEELNSKYNADRLSAVQQYVDLIRGVAPELFKGEDMEEAAQQLSTLRSLLMQYDQLKLDDKNTSGILTQINELTDSMDEGQIASYIIALTQLQDIANQAGINVNELFPEIEGINVTDMLGGYQTIGELLAANAGELPALAEMFGSAIEEEVMRVSAELDFGETTPTVDVTANVIGYVQAESGSMAITGVNIEEQTGKVTAYTQDGESLPIEHFSVEPQTGEIVAYTQGGEQLAISGVNLQGVAGKVTAYNQEGESLPIKNFSVEAQTGKVTAYTQEGEAIEIAGVNLKGVVGNVVAYTQQGETISIDNFNVTPESGEIIGYNQISGEIINFSVEPQTGEIVGYTQHGEKLSISGFNTEGLYGTIVGYLLDENAAMPTVQLSGEINPLLTSIALSNFRANNKIDGLTGNVDFVRFSSWLTPEKIKQQLEAGSAVFTDASGLTVNVGVGEVEQVYASTIFQGATVDENGKATYYYQIVGEIGSKESFDLVQGNFSTDETKKGLSGWLDTLDRSASGTIERINQAAAAVDEFDARLQEVDQSSNDALIFNSVKTQNLDTVRQSLYELSMDSEKIRQIAEYADYLMNVLSSENVDPAVAESAKAELQRIADLVSNSDEYMGVGNSISAGIADGLTEFGWSTSSATLESNLLNAINEEFAIHSPSKAMVPTGNNISAGIADGMIAFSFAEAAAAISASMQSNMSGYANSLKSSGYNFSAGLARGIRSGQSEVIRAATQVASAAIRAANNKLEISSPSRVMMESGEYAGEGLAIGMTREISTVEDAARSVAAVLTEASAVRNPARFASMGGYSGSRRAETIDYAMMRSAMMDAVRSIRLGVDIDSRRLATATADANSVAIDSRRGNIARGYGYR